jgi:hypothetical protein
MLAGAYATAFAANSVAITSPGAGAEVAVGIVRISGRYTGAYEITICLNGGDISDCHMEDPNGADAGTWYYDLDTSKQEGAGLGQGHEHRNHNGGRAINFLRKP